MRIATRGDRFLGAFIDHMWWTLITLIGYGIYSSGIITNGIILYSAMFLPFLLKDITGQSPGKRMAKTRIVLENTYKRPNFLLLVFRTTFNFILLFDVPFMFLNKRNKRLVDILMRTIVVKTK